MRFEAHGELPLGSKATLFFPQVQVLASVVSETGQCCVLVRFVLVYWLTSTHLSLCRCEKELG